MRFALIAALLFSFQVQGQEFADLAKATKATSCSVKENKIQFGSIQFPYKIYDSNVSLSKAHKCETININGVQFYSVLYSAEIIEMNTVQKILIYEIAHESKKTLKTVRSEVIDQIDMTSGDLPQTEFQFSLKTTWGTDKKDKKAILLKMEIIEKNKPTEPYLLKYNPKTAWFENVFVKTSKAEK